MNGGVETKIALVGEARGEYLIFREVAAELREQLGPGSVVHIEMDPRDLSDEERRSVLVPSMQPAFAAAKRIPREKLSERVGEAERRFGIPNLRRLWRTDLQRWRDGVGEDELARQAIGYLEVFDELFERSPQLAGGFAEDGGRLIKRAFRAVAVAHGRRMRVALSFAMPDRMVFHDQEEPFADLEPFEGFEPTEQELALVSAHIDRVRSGAVHFMAPRDLRIDARRIRNFGRLVGRAVMLRQPGDHAAHPVVFARDFVGQRARVETLQRASIRDLEGRKGVFYPIHAAYDTQIAIRGEGWRDQFATMQAIAEALPYGHELWVKPHPAAAGELSVLKLLALQFRVDNLVLIDPVVHAHEILRRADAVVTVNSTTGYEALFFGVPLVTLGKALYCLPEVCHVVGSPSELSGAIARALHEPPLSREATERFFAWCVRCSHEVQPLWHGVSAANTKRLADALIDVFALEPARLAPQ